MTLNQFILMIKSRLWLLLGIWAAVVLSAAVVTLSWPKGYTATAAVVLDVKSPDPIAGMVLPGLYQPGYMATQIDVLRSERVMKGVISKLRLDSSEDMRALWEAQTGGAIGTYDAWLSAMLLKNLDAVPAKESNVINVSFTTTDPAFAAAVANTVVDSYIDTTLELRVEPAKQYKALFDSQAKAAREKLEAAQKKLSDYQLKNGMVATDERMDIENTRLSELSSQLVAVQGMSADATSRRNAAAGSDDRSPEVLNNPVVTNLMVELSAAEANLKQSLATYGEAHPQIQQMKARVAETRQRLSAETAKVRASLGVATTASSQREGVIRAALEKQRARVLELRAQRDQLNVILKDVDNAQTAYDRITARLEQTSLESQSTQTNVSVLQRASPPFSPSSPKVGMNLALALVVGFIFAAGVVMSLELWDRRMRSADDVQVSLSLPMLGSITDSRQEMGPDRDVLQLSRTTSPATPELPQLAAPAQ